jgi:O-antigen/teichoic acid export membrane protein
MHSQKSDKLSLTRQSQILILGQITSYCFNFLVPIIVVRYFDVPQYGAYRQLFLVITTFLLILPFGLVESLYYFIPRNREQKQYYVSQAVWFSIVTGLIFFVLILGFGERLFASVKLSHLYDYSVPLTLYIIFMSVSLSFERLFVIDGRVITSSIITVISEVLKGFCIISSTILTRDLEAVVYALMFFSLLRVVVFFYYVSKNNLFALSPGKLDIERIKEHLYYSVPFGLSVVVSTLQRFMHQYFVSFLFSIRDFAIYAVGSLQLPLMGFIYSSVSSVILIRISECHKQKNYKKILEVWLNSSRKLSLIYFPVVVLFMIASREFITVIFTDRYVESIPIFIITLLKMPFDIFVTHSVLKAFAETRFIFKLNIILLPITVALIYVFIGLFGMIGATIATIASFGLIRIVELFKVKRLMGVTVNELIQWRIFSKILTACLLSGLFTLFVKGFMVNYTLLQIFLVEATIFSALYVSIVYFSGLLLESEKEDFKRIFNKIFYRFFLEVSKR